MADHHLDDYRRSATLRRTWLVLAYLRHCPRSLAYLASQTGVCPRTIRRDLYALEDAGIPLYTLRLNDGTRVWKVVTGAPCPICGRGPLKGAELRRELAATTVHA